MSYLEGIFERPGTLFFSLVLSLPFVWILAQMFFRDIARELGEKGPSFYVDAYLPDHGFFRSPPVKLVFLLLFSAAVIVLFYELCAWTASWWDSVTRDG